MANDNTRKDIRRDRFASEYLIDNNGTQAAIRAGYSPKSAGSIACELLKQQDIRERILVAERERAKRCMISADRWLLEVARIAYQDPRTFFDAKGHMKPIQELDDDTAAVLASIEVKEQSVKTEVDSDGNEHQIKTVIKKFKTWNKEKALDQIGEYLKALGDLPSQQSGGVGVNVFAGGGGDGPTRIDILVVDSPNRMNGTQRAAPRAIETATATGPFESNGPGSGYIPHLPGADFYPSFNPTPEVHGSDPPPEPEVVPLPPADRIPEHLKRSQGAMLGKRRCFAPELFGGGGDQADWPLESNGQKANGDLQQQLPPLPGQLLNPTACQRGKDDKPSASKRKVHHPGRKKRKA